MSPLDAIFHALNFLLPALAVALSMAFSGRVFKQKRPVAVTFIAQTAIHFIVCCAVLVIGLIVTGRDGKMMTYLAMVFASATVQCWLSGAWRK